MNNLALGELYKSCVNLAILNNLDSPLDSTVDNIRTSSAIADLKLEAL